MPQGKQTGIWLSEFAEPYMIFHEAGFRITVASSAGGKAPLDPRSIDADQESKWRDAIQRLENTLPVSQVSASEFSAIFLPGGHGTMFDLSEEQSLAELIRNFAEADKVIGAVCHGPAGLVQATLSSGEPFVKGKRLTAFTDEEERAAQLDSLMPFLLESKLRELGADFVAKPKWSNHIEVDGKLITGQNPQSSEATALKMLDLLQS